MNISIDQSHTVTTCGVCGTTFTVPEFLYDIRTKTGDLIFCPNGHRLTIPAPDEVRRLRSEVDTLTRQKDGAIETSRSLEREVARLYRRITSLKGSNTTLRNRLDKALQK